MGLLAIFLIVAYASSVHSFPPMEPITMRFLSCGWVAKCTENTPLYNMSIPCEGFCGSYIFCNGGDPILKHCNPNTPRWITWTDRMNFDPDLQLCTKEFDDCLWFKKRSFSHEPEPRDSQSDGGETKSIVLYDPNTANAGARANETTTNAAVNSMKSGVDSDVEYLKDGSESLIQKIKNEMQDLFGWLSKALSDVEAVKVVHVGTQGEGGRKKRVADGGDEAFSSSTYAHGLPDPPSLPPNELAFENCDWVADCDELSGKIPIPCPGHCDHFLLCIDNHPTMQQCDPVTSWLFWSSKTNFNPLSLQCEKDFNTCDWYKTVRLSGSMAAAEDSSELENSSNQNETGFDASYLKVAADSAMEDVLSDMKVQATAAVQQLAASTMAMVERLKEKAKGISDDVQAQTLQVLQDLKDNETANSKMIAQAIMKGVVNQIQVTSDQVKVGISSVVDNMNEKIKGVLSDFKNNASKVIESARENLHKMLPDQIENVSEAPETPVSSNTSVVVKEDDHDKETKTPAAPVEPVEEKKIDKRDLNDKETETKQEKAQETPQEKPQEQAQEKPQENPQEKPQGEEAKQTKPDEPKPRNGESGDAKEKEKEESSRSSSVVSSTNFFVFTLVVVIAQFL